MRTIVTLILVVGVLAGGCDHGSSGGTSTMTSEAASPTTGQPTTAPEPEPTTAPDPDASDPCVAGTWTLDLDSYQAFVDGTVDPELDGTASLSVVGGRIDIWFDDDIYYLAFVDLQTEIAFTDVDLVYERTTNGYATGSYLADRDGKFAFGDEENEYTVDGRAEALGIESSHQFSFASHTGVLTMEEWALIVELTYTCDDEVLELTVQYREELRLRFDRLEPVPDPICLFVPDC